MQNDPGGLATAAIQSGNYKLLPQLQVFQQGTLLNFTLPISSGTVTVDRNSATRRTADITIEVIPTVPPNPILPVTTAAPLAPFGNEVLLSVATQSATGVVSSYIPMGLFTIVTSTITDSTTDFAVTLHCYDRAWTIAQRKLKTPYTIPNAGATSDFPSQLRFLLNTVWGSNLPALNYNIFVPPLGAPTAPMASYNEGEDPWSAALDMATALGYELFFDVNGTVTAFPIPGPPNTASWPATVWTYTENTANAPKQIVDTFTRDGIYNDFIISGTGTTNAPSTNASTATPVRAEAQDTNPNSPTYISGPFGDVPQFGYSNLVTTAPQATSASQNALAASLSSAHQVSASVPANPLFDIDDVAAFNRARLSMAGTRVVADTLKLTIRHDDSTTFTGRVVT